MNEPESDPQLGDPQGLPDAPAGEAPSRHEGVFADRGFRWSVVALLVSALIVALGIAIRPPKVIITPGSADPVAPAITITGAPTYQNAGKVLFLTVLVTDHRPTLFELAAAALNDDAEVVDERQVLGDQSRKQNDRIDQALMSESQAFAKKAALTRLGYTIPLTGSGVYIAGVDGSGPAAGQLQPEDIVTAVNGQPTTTFDAFSASVKALPAGVPVVLAATRDGAAIERTITPQTNAKGQTIIGVTGFTANPKYSYPFDVTIDPGNVSGPSAGLAFSLGIIDELTPGDLTGRKKIAATGTIGPDGTVGPIGGVQQKAVAAKNAGAALMLVPADEVAEARAANAGIDIVGVATLDDALAALVAAGGTPIPNP